MTSAWLIAASATVWAIIAVALFAMQHNRARAEPKKRGEQKGAT